MRTTGSWAGAVLVLGLSLGGCADGRVAVPGAPSTPAGASGLLVGRGMVLDDGSGPEFCVGGVAESLPPQCDGPSLVGWVWPESGVESAGGVTWGDDYAVVGRFDGRRFTVERMVSADEAAASFPVPDEPDLTTPCPEPADGWGPVDPARSGTDDQGRVFALAAELPGYGGSWVDDRGDPTQPPETTVVNVRVTGDLAAAERRLREVWGGPLCVSEARYTQRELQKIADALVEEVDGLTGVGVDFDAVFLGVVHDDGTLQRELDERYGAGLVRVDSALRPSVG